MRVFIDTNLWAYRLDQREPVKSRRTTSWLADVKRSHEVVISTQVLIELRSVATRSSSAEPWTRESLHERP